MRFGRPLVLLALAALSAVGAVPLLARPVSAAGPTALVLDGHGNGHGYGLSQWGAYGYAVDRGWSAEQILSHYFGGTVPATVPATQGVSVRLQTLDNVQTAVVSATGGLVVAGLGGGPWKSVVARLVSATGAPAVYSVWARADVEVCPAATDALTTGWTLVSGAVSTKVDISTTADSVATTSYRDLASVCEPSGKVRAYRGSIRAVTGSVGEIRTVNILPLEQFVRSVVAMEMSPSWALAGGGAGVQALVAQAVASRTFALAHKWYTYADVCDRMCEAYFGAAWRASLASPFTAVEHPATDAVVLVSAGQVRKVGSATGVFALTMYAASTGGWTIAGTSANMPFPAVEDVGDSTPLNPYYNWSVTIPADTIVAKYPALGTYAGLVVLGRNGLGDWGGRVQSVRIDGTAGSVTLTGDAFKTAFGLRSNWFIEHGTPAPATTTTTTTSSTTTTSTTAPTTTVAGGSTTVPSTTAVAAAQCGSRVAPALVAIPSAAGSKFAPVSATRVVDTRKGVGTQLAPLDAGCTLVVAPRVPAGTTAVAVNLAAVKPATDGQLLAYPCGARLPAAQSLDAVAGRTVSSFAIVRLGAGGKFCVYSSIHTDVVVDVTGTFSPTSGQKFQPMTPVRLLDTQPTTSLLPANTVKVLQVTGAGRAPKAATSVSLTVHAVAAAADGVVKVYPCTTGASSVGAVNAPKGLTVGNQVVVAPDMLGRVCVLVSSPMDVVVVLEGWFGRTATSLYHPLVPARLVDTRTGLGGRLGALTANTGQRFALAGRGGLPAAASMKAVQGTVTVVGASASGRAAVHACLALAPMSTVRWLGGVSSSMAVVGASDAAGRWCVTPSVATQMVVDVSGWFG